MATRPTLYLVDGTSQLFRAYFAIRGLTNADGLPTGAVFGFTNMLRKLVHEEQPELLAVAFDLEGPTFRHDRYAEYKANRPPSPEDLNAQAPYAKEVCRGFNIPVLELPGYEADDLIATCAHLAVAAGLDVVVVASDKDLLQLVGPHVTVLNPSKGVRLDADGVAQSFGVPPDRVRDVLGLMGDSVDNIPGVPGVGEKTAIALVGTYGDLDAVVERARRFVAAFEDRDALIADLDSGADPGPGVERLLARLRRLSEVESDAGLRSRWEATETELTELPAPATWDAKARKGAVKLLKDLDKGTARKVSASIAEHEDLARLSRDLATVDRAAPVAFDPEPLRLGPANREKLAALFRALGFRSLTAEFSEGAVDPAPGRGAAGAPGPAATAGDARYVTVLSEDALRAVARDCREAGRIAVDTETTGTDPLRAKLVGISLAWRGGEGFYIPVAHDYLGAPTQIPLESIQAALGPLLADPAVRKVGQNFKYDLHVLRRHGMPVEGWELDTMVAAFLLQPDRSTFNLDSLAEELLGHTTIKYESLVGSGPRQMTLNQIDVERVTAYAAEDAEVTFRLARVLADRLESAGLEALYRDIDGALLPVLATMEALGIRVDVGILAVMSKEMEKALDESRRQVHALAGGAFNVDSPKQLRAVLFDKLGLKPGRKTAKSGAYSTDASTLEELAGEHEIAARLLEYRELAKLKGTYVDALPQLVNPETGRVHTSYHPTGAATGRLSSSDPNLQNIPARTPIGLRIRSAFVPEEGWVFLASDYSQVELRILAHLCGDPELREAFRRGEDIHRVTAGKVFGVSQDSVTDAMRRRAKAVNFGILYGMSENRLARDQGMSRAEAREFIAAYFDRFRSVRAYIDRVRADATRDGAVRTLFGRVRYFPQLRGRGSRAEVEQGLRAAVNTTIQGTAADLMKLAMLRVDRALTAERRRGRMLLQVHDELLLEVPREEIDNVGALVKREMEEVHRLEVPLAVDQKFGGDWRDVT